MIMTISPIPWEQPLPPSLVPPGPLGLLPRAGYHYEVFLPGSVHDGSQRLGIFVQFTEYLAWEAGNGAEENGS